jgi:hypothetical protein
MESHLESVLGGSGEDSFVRPYGVDERVHRQCRSRGGHALSSELEQQAPRSFVATQLHAGPVRQEHDCGVLGNHERVLRAIFERLMEKLGGEAWFVELPSPRPLPGTEIELSWPSRSS